MRRILIVRTSAIGDIVFASPVAAAIKHARPEAHVAWLVESGLESLLEADPCVDRILSWPKREWLKLWRERRLLALARAVRDFRRMLLAQGFDTVLDLQGLFKSGLLARLSGAPRRVGLGSREGSRWLMTEVVTKGGDDDFISSEYAFLAEHLGLSLTGFAPRIHRIPAAARNARQMLTQAGIAPHRYAVLAPFTTRPQKHWPESAWRALIAGLVTDPGLVPVVLGGPGDREAAARICAGDGHHALNLAGTTSLAEAAALIADAALVIGVDTGLTHAGVAFQRPTVALFGSTCPYRTAARRDVRVIWLGLACSPCRRRPGCDGAHDCLAAISPARVLDEAHIALAAADTLFTSPTPSSRSIPLPWSPSCSHPV